MQSSMFSPTTSQHHFQFGNLQNYNQFYFQPHQFQSFQAPNVRTPDRREAGGAQGTQVGGYILGPEICEGSYGIVRQAVKMQDQGLADRPIYAIKVVPAGKYDDNEVKLQKKLAHPHILRVHEKFTNGDLVYLVLEYCPGGDLFEYITSLRKPVDEGTARVFFRQMLAAVMMCHRNKIAHHDVKLENFLLAKDNTVRLCDFGAAEDVGSSNGFTSRYKGEVSAPEKQRGATYNGWAADIYQLGKSLHEFLFCLQGPNANGSLNPAPGYRMTAELQNLLYAMLCLDPSKRPSIEEIARHSWVGGLPLPGFSDKRRGSDDSNASSNFMSEEESIPSPPTSPAIKPQTAATMPVQTFTTRSTPAPMSLPPQASNQQSFAYTSAMPQAVQQSQQAQSSRPPMSPVQTKTTSQQQVKRPSQIVTSPTQGQPPRSTSQSNGIARQPSQQQSRGQPRTGSPLSPSQKAVEIMGNLMQYQAQQFPQQQFPQSPVAKSQNRVVGSPLATAQPWNGNQAGVGQSISIPIQSPTRGSNQSLAWGQFHSNVHQDSPTMLLCSPKAATWGSPTVKGTVRI